MIILLGYMGCGKSSIGQYISQEKDVVHCDLDSYIEEKESLSIPEIFKIKGEIYFRKIEHKYLSDILIQNKCKILSLGGGTPCYADNMQLINSHQYESYYLKVNLEKLTNRLFEQKNDRPLISGIQTKEALNDFIRKHLFEREYYYRQANNIIDVSEMGISEIALKITEKSTGF